MLGLPHGPSTLAQADRAERLLALMTTTPAPPLELIRAGTSADVEARVEGLAQHVQLRHGAWTQLGQRYRPQLLELGLDDLLARFSRWGQAFFLVAFFMLWGARRALRRALVPGAKLPSNADVAEELELARTVQAEDRAITSAETDAKPLLGRHWKGNESDPDELRTLLQWGLSFRRILAGFIADGVEAVTTTRLATLVTEQADALGPETSLGSQARAALASLRAFREARLLAERLLVVDARLAWSDGSTIADVAGLAKQWHGDLPRLRDWAALCRAAAGARDDGLGPIVDGFFDRRLAPAQLRAPTERAVFEWWWEGCVAASPMLAAFRGAEHDAHIGRFRALDKAAEELARGEVRARLAARLPDFHAPGNEMALLRRQFQLKTRHRPIRRLFAEVSGTLSRLKPCVLMSPLSVAQYLDPSLQGYDVVVFDEASQIPPWDAIGAIARGNRVIVVGDSKQLPPTSFFSRGDDDELDVDDEDMQELESILDEAIGAGVPQLSLRWHYRSRHESLIAFSNHHYYSGNLLTFPSSQQKTLHLGVELHPVPNGYYDRGASRTNRAEAEAVVDEVVRLLRLDAPPSIGIVTFSMVQQRLIEDLLEVKLQAAPELQTFFSDAAAEPVFVKNLENVQGDERDVMLFSICYGPDRAGKVAMNFGPLNRKGGERRLNVAVTRARKRTVVFATISPDQIDLGRTRALGVAHLKTYLDYARRGMIAIDAATTSSLGEVESPFEEDVKRCIEALDWAVDAQVGASGYRIDLAVRHPHKPGTYLLGVECDGATYHSSRCARERDRLRQAVLEGLGWRLHRIWSSDWWLDPEGQLAKVQAALDSALRAESTPPATERLECQRSP